MSPRTRRLLIWGCLPLIAVTVLLPCGFFGLWFVVSAGSSSGSPTLAKEWRDELYRHADPDATNAADENITVVKFPDGSWFIARSQDSHGVWRRGGGTIVFKDSTGQVRAFFGHVCGAQHVERWAEILKAPGLDAYYKQLSESGFNEHHFGPVAGTQEGAVRP